MWFICGYAILFSCKLLLFILIEKKRASYERCYQASNCHTSIKESSDLEGAVFGLMLIWYITYDIYNMSKGESGYTWESTQNLYHFTYYIMFFLAYLFEGYQCDWIIFCQVIDLSLASHQVLPDAPCSNEIFIDLAFEGIQRAFGEAADVALNVKRLGARVTFILFFLLVSKFSWFTICPLYRHFILSQKVKLMVTFVVSLTTHYCRLTRGFRLCFFFGMFFPSWIFIFFLFLKRCIVPLLLFTMHEVSQIESAI